MLEQHEVAPYLLRRGLVMPQRVVEGDLLIVDVSRRNSNFKVVSEQGPSYLLKQATDAGKAATLAHEAAVYTWLQTRGVGSGFSRYAPRLHDYDPEERVLVLELVRGAENLLEYHRRRGRFPTRLGAALGKVLGALHNLVLSEANLMDVPDEMGLGIARGPSQANWILSIHRPVFGGLREISGANLQLIRIVQQACTERAEALNGVNGERNPDFPALLDELRDGWRAETLIHGDVKWSNLLAFSPRGSRRKTGLLLVDWELACAGDPRWDVGSAFADYLAFWLLSIPVVDAPSPRMILPLARYPLEEMQPAMSAFWSAYVRARGAGHQQAEEWLVRAVRYCAARLVQKAYEHGQDSQQLTSNSVLLLQLGLNILHRPHQAISRLLGVAPGEPGST